MADRVGQQLGNYRLIRLLGQGGFAQVYLGEHIFLGIQAAIKVLLAQMASHELEHFLREAQTIATLKHPNIVRVLDFGVDRDASLPFLVLDYAAGGTFRHRYPRGSVLAVETIVPSVNQVAAALQYAHDRHMIHRDVKPENMLLDSANTVLLSDFGIAVAAHSTHSLATQEAIGTVAYMAPEQLKGKARPASDQYSLGVVVYEWLCGACPFEGATFIEIAMSHLTDLPSSLCAKVPSISTEVEQVVLTALAKEPQQRWTSVQAFAQALEQASLLAEGKSVLPPTQLVPIEIAPAHSLLSQVDEAHPSFSMMPTVPPTGVAASPSLDVEAKSRTSTPPTSQPPSPLIEAVTQPPHREHLPEIQLPPVPTLTSQQMVSSPHSRAQTSDQPVVDQKADETSYQPIAGRVVDYDQSQLVRGNAFTMFYHGFLSSSSQVYLHWGKNGWQDVGTGDEPMAKRPDGFWQTRITIPIDATQMNLAFHDGSGRWDNNGGKNWNLALLAAKSRLLEEAPSAKPPLGTVLYTYRDHSDEVRAVAWSPDGRRITSANRDSVVVWDAATGREEFTCSDSRGAAIPGWCLAWSPDGTRIAAGFVIVYIIDATTGHELINYYGGPALAWSPDSTRIASIDHNHFIRVWDAQTGRDVLAYKGHKKGVGSVDSIAWSPDGKRIVSTAGRERGAVQVWDATTGRKTLTYQGHPSSFVTILAWSPDGQRIASGSTDQTVQVWDATTGQTLYTYRGHTDCVLGLAWSPDGQRIASGSTDQTVQVWDAATGAMLLTYRGHTQRVSLVAWSPDGTRIASGSDDQTVQVWQAQ